MRHETHPTSETGKAMYTCLVPIVIYRYISFQEPVTFKHISIPLGLLRLLLMKRNLWLFFVRFIWGNLIYMEINIGQLIVASASMLLRREYKKNTERILINLFEQELFF